MAAKSVTLEWTGRGMVFDGRAPDRAPVVIDGETGEGPSPMDALLLSLAGCMGSDIVLILAKKRLDLRALRMDVSGERREEPPRRYVSIRLGIRVEAPGATETQVRQAVDLSLEKYCSVAHSLQPDIPISYELELQA